MKGTTPAEVLSLYGLTLMICGALSFYASGMQSKAKSSIFIGNGSAVICFVLAFGVRNMNLHKGDPGYVLMMICIHLALVFPLVMTGVVSWRLALAWPIAEKAYVRPYFIGIVVSSLLCFAIMYTFKPKKNKPADSEEKDDTTSLASEIPDDQATNENEPTDSNASKERRRVPSRQTTAPTSNNVVRKRARRATAM